MIEPENIKVIGLSAAAHIPFATDLGDYLLTI